MNTSQAVEAARKVLTEAAPMLWIQLTEQRTVAGVRALARGVDPNQEDRRGWIFVGEFKETDAALLRAVLMKRSGSQGPRGRMPDSWSK